MNWQLLRRFRDPAVPKLNNLRRAAEAGLRVPATYWLPANAIGIAESPFRNFPVILRSGSPTEDERITSNAGQLLSLVVNRPDAFADSLRKVIEALPCDTAGRPLGAVVVQPLVPSIEAGVAFFDGFYFERTAVAGRNFDLTAGQARGEVQRGHLRRAAPWSEWLRQVYAVFGRRDRVIDVEFARDRCGYVLLQCRPALFPVRRNPTLTLANHRETLGALPSPWTVSSMALAATDLSFLASVEPAIGTWNEAYAVEAAGRAWLNLAFVFRWMDHIGVPRSIATASVGGEIGSPADRAIIWRPFLRAAPKLLGQSWQGVRKVLAAPAAFREIDRRIDSANGLSELFAATVAAWTLGLQTAFAIAGLLAMMSRLRSVLRLPSSAQLVTQTLMDGYDRLTTLPDPAARIAGLDAWLTAHGHRGPFESDFARPRFSELRDVLLRDLSNAPVRPASSTATPRRLAALTRPFYRIDEWREWFRDESMRRWGRIRERLLAEGTKLVAAGSLDQTDDVFWLHGDDLAANRLRDAVATRRRLAEVYRHLPLPLTASLDEIEQIVTTADAAEQPTDDRRVFPGIALSPAIVEGIARKADDLMDLLKNGAPLDSTTVLVVPTLEPSWAVVFPRVLGVVAEVGGELSHASILLREARKPAVVNCAGIFAQVRDGERLRIDGAHGRVERLSSP
jgi:phosphohistidine swiveling domain-containing protein